MNTGFFITILVATFIAMYIPLSMLENKED